MLIEGWCTRSRYWFVVEHVVLLLEALIGTDAAFTAIVDVLERAESSAWRGHDVGGLFGNALTHPTHAMGFLVGFLLLRTHDEGLRARLVALHAGGRPRTTLHMCLDLALNGAEAVRRAAPQHLFAAHFVTDDAEVVQSLSASAFMHASLSPRFAWLGGPAVHADFVRRAEARGGVPAPRAKQFIDEFGTIRSPQTVALMMVMAKRKATRKRTLAWFEAHRTYVNEHRDQVDAFEDAATIEAVAAVLE